MQGCLSGAKEREQGEAFIEGFCLFFLIAGFFVGANLLLSHYAVQFNMVIAVAGIALAFVVHRVVETRIPA